MSTYAIGDLQGCYQELLALLDDINFDEDDDRLWFTGDLVNRGPESLQTLRFVRAISTVTVLGNHDLHCLAVAAGKAESRKNDTFEDILNAADRDELLHWLRHLPLLFHDQQLGYTMVHAGLPPQWDLSAANTHAKEVEECLRGPQADQFFSNMYGDQPDLWSEDLAGWDRLRFITNCFTRMRYCDAEGRLTLKDKGPPGSQAAAYMPWFDIAGRKTNQLKIIFGHWASLRHGNINNFNMSNVYPLDSGCLWGGKLTAMRLEDGQYFTVPCRQQAVK